MLGVITLSVCVFDLAVVDAPSTLELDLDGESEEVLPPLTIM